MKPFVLMLVVSALLQPAAASSRRVHISVAGLFHSSQFAVESSPAQPLIASTKDREFTLGANGHERVLITRREKRLLLQTAKDRFLCDSVTFASAQNGDADFTLSVPNRFARAYRGRLTLLSNGRELVAVVEMNLETAVASAVAAESPPGAPLEALKAQAVVSRSYFVAAGRRHPLAEFCDTTHCQFVRNPPAASSLAARAARETDGLVLTWNGKVFPALYSAQCGGRTRTLAETGPVANGYPYFAVKCSHCARNPGRTAGHGLGLCQNGAAAMASDGKDFREILSHYFPNTTLNQSAGEEHF
ncbi:MAG TPA: SpoIID/LytB domain-containing protein [Terriglobales bacterium]